jgi:hypothetical protein
MSKEVDENYNNAFHFSVRKRLFYLFLSLFILLVILLAVSFLINFNRLNAVSSIESCGDGSFSGTCSLTKPYYCDENKDLVLNTSLCGCSEDFSKGNGVCFSSYSLYPKVVTLNYILNGERDTLDYTVYGGVDEYLSSLSQSINYYSGEISSRADFKTNKINEEVQRDFLMSLVVEIQNIAPENRDDQARIAISIVQNIPYGESEEKYIFGNQEITYSRYPYQVLYDNRGICGEKTELLAFLLREIGYGTSFFYYPEENHESLGISCPVYRSFSGTGYCFVETTAPSIISDNNINYADIGKLKSYPEVFFISDGLIFGENNFYEYKDSKQISSIRSFIENRGWIGPIKKNDYEKLRDKYGLVDEYYGE